MSSRRPETANYGWKRMAPQTPLTPVMPQTPLTPVKLPTAIGDVTWFADGKPHAFDRLRDDYRLTLDRIGQDQTFVLAVGECIHWEVSVDRQVSYLVRTAGLDLHRWPWTDQERLVYLDACLQAGHPLHVALSPMPVLLSVPKIVEKSHCTITDATGNWPNWPLHVEATQLDPSLCLWRRKE